MPENLWGIALYVAGLSLFHYLGAREAHKKATALYEAQIAEAHRVINEVHELWSYVMENSPEARRLAVNFQAIKAAQQQATPAEAGDRVK